MVESAPQGTHLAVLAVRGFGKLELYECCAKLGVDHAIRFRNVILVIDSEGNHGQAENTSCRIVNRPYGLRHESLE
jgi:hypothetical protein